MDIFLIIVSFFGGFAMAAFLYKTKLATQKVEMAKVNNASTLLSATTKEESEQQINQLISQHEQHAKVTIDAISQVLDESADSSATTTQSLSEVTNKIQDLSALIAKIIDLSNSASQITDSGMVNVDSVVKDLTDLSESKADLATILNKFNEVQDKTKAIRYIGEEAEMLALNAAIEAARAGDAGRGFAVVADSMKSLAKNSQDTTNEILAIVKESDKTISFVAESFSQRGEKLDFSINGLVNNFTQINNSVVSIKSHSQVITEDSKAISSLMTKTSSITKTNVEKLVKSLSKVASSITGKDIIDLSPNEAKDQWDSFDEIIDVRHAEEWDSDLGHISGVRLSNLQTDFKADVQKLDHNKRYLFVCRSGGRSTKAAQMAIARGVEQVYNLDGGMLEWRAQGF